MKKLNVFVNSQQVHECDRDVFLDEQRQAFLDRMDSDMARGLKLQGELISEPDTRQRAKFVSMNLVKALKQQNEGIISVSCAYLVNRMPAVKEIHISYEDNGIAIEFIEEH